MANDRLMQLREKHKKHIKFIDDLLFKRPLLKFIGLIVLAFIMHWFPTFVPSAKNLPDVLFILPNILVVVYFALLIIHLARHSLNKLLNANNILVLIASYTAFVASILLLFSMSFNAIEITEHGYLTYGTCSDSFTKDMITKDPSMSQSYFYFTAVTFFSVGYGDICPMGFAKTLAVLVSFIGHIINVVVMVIVVHHYLKRKENNKDRK